MIKAHIQGEVYKLLFCNLKVTVRDGTRSWTPFSGVLYILGYCVSVKNTTRQDGDHVGCFWNNHAAAKSLQSCPTLCDPIDQLKFDWCFSHDYTEVRDLGEEDHRGEMPFLSRVHTVNLWHWHIKQLVKWKKAEGDNLWNLSLKQKFY